MFTTATMIGPRIYISTCLALSLFACGSPSRDDVQAGASGASGSMSTASGSGGATGVAGKGGSAASGGAAGAATGGAGPGGNAGAGGIAGRGDVDSGGAGRAASGGDAGKGGTAGGTSDAAMGGRSGGDGGERDGSGAGNGGTNDAGAPRDASGSDASPGDGGPTPCSAVTLPDYSLLPTLAKLPDPFLSTDGTRITRKDQWACRRGEIGAQAQRYELGPKPDRPEMVTGSFSNNQITVSISNAGKSISFSATITVPSTGSPPYPAMIGIGGISLGDAQLRSMGVATIIFPNDAIAAQVNASSRGQGSFYTLYGNTHSAGAMIAWAWGVSRLIDALEKTPLANIDPKRLGVTGCSRNGKGALIAGAFDERIALTIPQESGSGGSASWRVSDAMLASGTMVQTLSEITGENVWFMDAFKQFNNTATKLPFDHHMIEAMVAPRALLVVENTSQVWLGNLSTYTNSMAAHLVWEALGLADKMGVSQIGDHSHCQWNGSQQAEVTGYVQKFLVGSGTGNTDVLKTDGSYTFDRANWVPWTVPMLQ